MIAQTSLMNQLEEALSQSSEDRRARTLHRIADLFVFGSSHFSADHVAVFDGVFSHMVVDVEQSARQMLAERLSGVTNAPPNVIRTLAFDHAIDVARPVLEGSPVLDNATLVENAKVNSQDHLLAISRRKTLADTVTDILVERGDRAVALSTAANAGASFSPVGFVRLVTRSKDDDELARTVGGRPEIPRQLFLKLLGTASKAVRIALEAAHPDGAGEIRSAVAQVANKVQAAAAAASRDYAAARMTVESMRASGSLNEGEIAAFAGAEKFEETVLAISALSGLPLDIVERALTQDRPDTIMILAKAGGLSWPTAKSLLLLAAGKAPISPQAFVQHQNVFGRIKPETACQIISFLRRPQ